MNSDVSQLRVEAWSDDELEAVQKELLSEAEALRRKLETAAREATVPHQGPSDASGQDEGELGSSLSEQEHELALAEHLRERLAQTERAIERIGQGVFGRCENCGQPIAKERLEAYPRATVCMQCKQRGL